MASSEKELALLRKKVDLLIDGYQVLYIRLEQQTRLLQRMHGYLRAMNTPVQPDDDAATDLGKVVRISERFLTRVRNHRGEPNDPDESNPI